MFACLCREVLKPSGTAIIFCSFEQFPFWCWAMRAESLIVEPAPLVILKKYPGGLQLCWWALKNVVEIAVIVHKETSYYRTLEQVSPSSLHLILTQIFPQKCPESKALQPDTHPLPQFNSPFIGLPDGTFGSPFRQCCVDSEDF